MADQLENNGIGEELVKQDVITREELARAREREKVSGVPWYRQLMQGGQLNFGIFENVLRHEFHPKAKREEQQSLGRALLEMGAISKAQLEEALLEQRRNGRLLGNVLEEKGYVTHQAKAIALSRQYGMDFADLNSTPSDQDALECVPESMARKNEFLPVRLEGDRLTVLITTPQQRSALKDVGILLGKRITPLLTSTDDFRTEIRERYKELRYVIAEEKSELKASKRAASKAPAQEETKSEPEPKPEPQETAKPKRKSKADKPAKETKAVASEIETNDISRFDEIAREASGASVVKLVQTIIEGAANSGATDIHLDPQEPETRVRYRIDGVLHDVMSIPEDIVNAVVSRVKILSDMDITENRHPQDGHMSLEVGDDEYDVRVATLPTFLGERVVLRLLDQTNVLSGIKDLGLESEDEKKLTKAIEEPYGMILVTGPTGSGKTTTLYASLNQKNVMTDSIVTLEDPVEYQLSGINQVQIDTDIEVTFASTLRAALRQDIDVLMVGEIRDAETARIAIRAAMTGHLVFSTLHTNDATEAISTLRNMGIPSYLIASALTAVVGQRLVRTICPECKAGYVPNKTLLKSIGLPESTRRLYRGKGCEVCYHTGNRGRTGVFEVLSITPEVRKLIAEDAPIEKVTKAAKLKTMGERARAKVKKGLVPAEELLRVVRA